MDDGGALTLADAFAMIAALTDRVAMLEAERQPKRLQPRPADLALLSEVARLMPLGQGFRADGVLALATEDEALNAALAGVCSSRRINAAKGVGDALARLARLGVGDVVVRRVGRDVDGTVWVLAANGTDDAAGAFDS